MEPMIASPLIRPERLRARLEALAAQGGEASGGGVRGVSRFPFSAAHAEAVRLVAAWMEEAGLSAGCDEFGNLIGTTPGSGGRPAVILGSHLDTVPCGGMFDGALGVVAGVEVAAALHESGRGLYHALAVVGFADEEGQQFGVGTLASRCVTGRIPRERFTSLRGRDGRTLSESLAAFAPGLPGCAFPEHAAAYLELHIEQGPVLSRSGRRVALVNTITGIARTVVILEGEANHAGTTPMVDRRDALVGAADVILAVHSLARAAGAPAVGTVGALSVSPGASNVVPGRAEFSVEFRTTDGAQLRGLCTGIGLEARQVAQSRGLSCHIGDWDLRDPVPMDEGIQRAIARAIQDVGFEPFAMPSGAGHDAMVMAQHVPSGMIFVPSAGGISHSPREWTDWEDAALGAEVLLRTVMLLEETARNGRSRAGGQDPIPGGVWTACIPNTA